MPERKSMADVGPDPELSWWLARSHGSVVLSPMERARLRARILHAAEPVLASRRLPEPWWAVAAGWARPSLPLAAAAAAVLLILVSSSSPEADLIPGPQALTLPGLEALLVDILPADEMPWFTAETVETGTLLQAALEFR